MGLDVEECSLLELDMDFADHRNFLLTLWTQTFMGIQVVGIFSHLTRVGIGRCPSLSINEITGPFTVISTSVVAIARLKPSS